MQAPAQGAAAATAPTTTSPARTAAAPEPRSERRIRGSTAPAAPAAPIAGGGDDDDDRIIPIVIIGFGAHPGRETVFTTQDGATWVQTDSQRVGVLPDPPFEAEIKPGALGSYFLVPKEKGRAIRVRNATP